jgi:hypothetical protein
MKKAKMRSCSIFALCSISFLSSIRAHHLVDLSAIVFIEGYETFDGAAKSLYILSGLCFCIFTEHEACR